MRYPLVTCALAALATAASADTLSIMADSSTSAEHTGSMFSGSLEYIFDAGNTGTLLVSLNNDTTADIGGFLTGFVFNIDSQDANASASLTFGTNINFLDTGEEIASPFGMFDAGAALGANWEGGGEPSFGMSIGSSDMFEFMVTASDASLLSASSFVGDGSEFAVRFRGLNDGGSDKILTPAPGTGALVFCGLAYAGRRRR
jgi:hypothetical protein